MRYRKGFELRIYIRYMSKHTKCIHSTVEQMKKSELFEISRNNAKWLKKNYPRLMREYDKRWIVVRNREVVHSASTFKQVMRNVKKHNPNEILVEFIESEPIAMFF